MLRQVGILRKVASSTLLLGLVAACSSEETPPVWRPTSVRFELSLNSYWEGPSAYARDRVDLSAEQLRALEALRTIPTPTGSVGNDMMIYRLRIVDQDGSSVTYRAAEANVLDEERTPSTPSTIDVASLEPLLDTFHCLSGVDTKFKARESTSPADPTADDISKATSLPMDVGCTNGMFISHACSDTFLTLDVTEPARYRIAARNCRENMVLRLFTSDGGTQQAESVSTAMPDACLSLEHSFDRGKYVLVLSKTNAAECSASFPLDGFAGHTSLRLSRVE